MLETLTMERKTRRYTPELKRQMVQLLRGGRSSASLHAQFGPSASTISLWAKQAGTDGGKGDGVLTTEQVELAQLRRENGKLKEELEILSKAAAGFTDKRSHEELYGFVKLHQAMHPIGMLCRLLKVSRSGFYAWRNRPTCTRQREDLILIAKIQAIHSGSNGAYGYPRIQAELADNHGFRVSRKRVARLMRAVGLRGLTRSP
jgi:transposase-like protein